MSLLSRFRRTAPQTTATVELAVGEYNGAPMVSMLICDPAAEAEAERERERQEWWDSLGPEGQAEHERWEAEETASWLAWADENARRRGETVA